MVFVDRMPGRDVCVKKILLVFLEPAGIVGLGVLTELAKNTPEMPKSTGIICLINPFNVVYTLSIIKFTYERLIRSLSPCIPFDRPVHSPNIVVKILKMFS